VHWLPYGVPVPPGQVLTALPEPYTPRKHGALLPDQTPESNLIGLPGFVVGPSPRRFPARGNTPASTVGPSPGTGDHPIFLYTTSVRWNGVSAVHDVHTDLAIPTVTTLTNAGAVFIYSPTLLPPGGSCIEATTIHQRTQFDNATTHLQSWYDWCGYNFQNHQNNWFRMDSINASFINRYVRTFNGQPSLSITIVTPTNYNGCWFGSLYNYLVGGWEQKMTSCGTTQIGHSTGWTMFESYNLMDFGCPTIQSTRASAVNFADPRPGPDWVPITDYPNDYSEGGSSYGTCFAQNVYTFQFPAPNVGPNSWLAKTPNP
jgi:hypothetical protein